MLGIESSNALKREELFDRLFRSLEGRSGIDILNEPEDPIKAYYDRCERGECDPKPMSMVVSFVQANGDKEKFLTGYPEKLRNHLWEISERIRQGENE